MGKVQIAAFGLLLAYSADIVAQSAVQAIENPIPEVITKGDIRVAA